MSFRASSAVADDSPAPRVRSASHPGLRAFALMACGLVLLPILSIAYVALSGSGQDWPHLAANVLPRASVTTLQLLAMVAVATSFVGVATAWMVVSCDFPLRRTLSWALVLPLAVPSYLAAYAFGEFFHYSGPVQTLVRGLFGFTSIRDYWFPDIRTATGCALVLSAVLYPYVYLTTRVVFLMQGRAMADAARTLGAKPGRVFRRVLLPVARPAIVAGTALVLMETVNDIGAAEYLGVRTLTFAVYETWLARGSLEGGAQLALVMLVVVVALLAAEQAARQRQRFHGARASQMRAHPARTRLRGVKRWAATGLVALPVLVGFGIPMAVFGTYAMRRLDQFLSPSLGAAFLNSVATAAATAAITVLIALFLLNAVRVARSRGMTAAVKLASIGYAMPGGIVGLGLLFALARFDNAVDAFFRAHLGLSTGLLLTGSAGAVVIACVIRFMALAEGTMSAGMQKLPPHLDQAARCLGRTPLRSATDVLLPLLKPAILTALVLVFVDTVKELSATILLRPFGFSTLATQVYENASRGAPEEAAAGAIVIIVTALVPVVLLSRSLARDRDV